LGPEAELDPIAPPEAVRGLYVNAHVAGSLTRLMPLLMLAEDSPVNAFVIDVKDHGEVSYASSVPLVSEIDAGRAYIANLKGLLRTLRERGIYPIARIVAFRDPVLAEARPELAIRTSQGGPWLDPGDGRPWVDPFNREVWEYNIALAREALEAGFAEVQWDYVRLPDVSESERASMVFPAQDGRTAGQAIEEFLAMSRRDLADFGAPIAADVFGRVITEPGDSGIGQEWDRLARVTDVLHPMVYPALYWPGNFGLADPDAEPYGLVRAAMERAVARMRRTEGAIADLRPWLQAFTLGSTVYGPDQMRAQIRAVEDAGLSGWLFWNPNSVYPEDAF
jgi:hypothetical protein